MATDSILKKGYLYQFKNKKEVYGWERLYFVLHGQSSKNEARLDWYESLESSVSNPGLRSGIFLEEITRVERIAYQFKMESVYGPSALFLFGIYTCRKDEPYVMKCVDSEGLNDWLQLLSRLLRDVRLLKRKNNKKAKVSENVYSMHNTPQSLTFAREVNVEETAAAQRQGVRGRHRIVLSRQHLSLTNPDDSGTVLFWHYSHVRRFGYSDRTFTIEGGQRSGPGEGLFILKDCDGHALFGAVQEKIRLLRTGCDELQSFSSPAVGSNPCVRAPPSERQGCDKDTTKAVSVPQDRPHAATPKSTEDHQPNSSKGSPGWEPGFTGDRDDSSAENALQQPNSDGDNDDEDSSGDDETSMNKKPKIPPKNFDLGSVAMQVDPQATCDYSASGTKNVDGAKTKGHQSKADKAFRGSSVIHFGPFKRFISPPPDSADEPSPPAIAAAAAAKARNDGSFDRVPLVNCWDDAGKDDSDETDGSPVQSLSPVALSHPKISEKKPFWKSSKGDGQKTDDGRRTRPQMSGLEEKSEEQRDATPPPPLKPKILRRGVTANNDEELSLVAAPSVPSKKKPTSREQKDTRKKKPPRRREVPSISNTPSATSIDPGRYVGSKVMTPRSVQVAGTTLTTEDLPAPPTPFGPKISEVLLHLESCKVTETEATGDNITNTDGDFATDATAEDTYNRIDLRGEASAAAAAAAAAAGRARTVRDATDDEYHLYGQSLICQMGQRVQDEPLYEDIVLDATPKKNSNKKKK